MFDRKKPGFITITTRHGQVAALLTLLLHCFCFGLLLLLCCSAAYALLLLLLRSSLLLLSG